MNEEEKYQLYLSNGGEASFEEWQSVSSMFSPEEMDELVGLKKKVNQQENPLSNQTSVPISNDLELNPAQEQQLQIAQSQNSMASDSMLQDDSSALGSTIPEDNPEANLDLSKLHSQGAGDSFASLKKPAVLNPEINNNPILSTNDDNNNTPIKPSDEQVKANKDKNYYSSFYGDTIFKINKNKLLELPNQKDENGNPIYTDKFGTQQFVFKDGVLQIAGERSSIDEDGNVTALAPLIYGKDFKINDKGIVTYPNEWDEETAKSPTGQIPYVELNQPTYLSNVDTSGKTVENRNNLVRQYVSEGKGYIETKNNKEVKDEDGNLSFVPTDENFVKGWNQEIGKINANVDRNKEIDQKNLWQNTVKNAEIENDIYKDQVNKYGKAVVDSYGGILTTEEQATEDYKLKLSNYLQAGLTEQEAQQRIDLENQQESALNLRTAQSVISGIIDVAENDEARMLASNSKDATLTASEKSVWQNLSKDEDFGKWWTNQGLAMFGDSETGLLTKTNSSTITLRKRVYDTYRQYQLTQLSDNSSAVIDKRDNALKSQIQKALKEGNINEVNRLRNERQKISDDISLSSNQFNNISHQWEKDDKNFDYLYKKSVDEANEYAGYQNNNFKDKALYSLKNIANGVSDFVTDIAAIPIAIASPFSENASKYLSSFNYALKNPNTLSEQNFGFDEYKTYEDSKGNKFRIQLGKVFNIDKEGNYTYNEKANVNDIEKLKKTDSGWDYNLGSASGLFSNMAVSMLFPEFVAGKFSGALSTLNNATRITKNAVRLSELVGKESAMGKAAMYLAKNEKTAYSMLTWWGQTLPSNIDQGLQAGLNNKEAFVYGFGQSLGTALMTRVSPDEALLKEYDAVSKTTLRLLSENKWEATKLAWKQFGKTLTRGNLGENSQEITEYGVQKLIDNFFNIALGKKEDGTNYFEDTSFDDVIQTFRDTTIFTTALQTITHFRPKLRLNINNLNKLQQHIVASQFPEVVSQVESVIDGDWSPEMQQKAKNTKAEIDKINKYTEQIPENTNLSIQQTEQFVLAMNEIDKLEQQKAKVNDALYPEYDSRIKEKKDAINQIFSEAKTKNKVNLNAKKGAEVFTTEEEETETPITDAENPQPKPPQETVQTKTETETEGTQIKTNDNSEINTNFTNDESTTTTTSELQRQRQESNSVYQENQVFRSRLGERIGEAEAQLSRPLTHHEREDVEKQAAFDFAKENNLWTDDIYSLGDQSLKGGNENTLVLDRESGTLYKSNNLFNSKNSIAQFFEGVEGHNAIFPNSQYTFVGFTGTENKGKTPYVEPIVSQKYIPNTEQATQEEIDAYMESKGFEKINNHTFRNEEYTVSDLRPRNVLKDSEGNIHVIDDIVTKNQTNANETQKHNQNEETETQPNQQLAETNQQSNSSTDETGETSTGQTNTDEQNTQDEISEEEQIERNIEALQKLLEEQKVQSNQNPNNETAERGESEGNAGVKINNNQTRITENVIASIEEITLPDGEKGYKVTVTDDSGNLIEDKNGDSEFEFSSQEEADKFINQKQKGYGLQNRNKPTKDNSETKANPSKINEGEKIRGNDGRLYNPKSNIVSNVKDSNDNVIQFQITDDLSSEEKSIIETAKSNGTYMKAPNGKPTNLTEKQWAQTRTKNFKDWFGDWENDIEGSSKAVDENGEPKLFWHRTDADFNTFDINKHGTNTDAGWLGEGFYFYGVEEESYGYGKNSVEVFLNIREPYFASNEDNLRLSKENDIEVSKQYSDEIKFEGYDGVFFNGDFREETVAFYPNQIKSATNNKGSFSNESNDIRFQNNRLNTNQRFSPISKQSFDSLIERLKKPFAKAFKNLNVTTDFNFFLDKAKALGISDKNIQKLEVLSQDFRDSHTAPSMMGYESVEEALEDGYDVNLSEVITDRHNAPQDFFSNEQYANRMFTYAFAKESLKSLFEVKNRVKNGADPKTALVKVYRAVPSNIETNNLIPFDWVSLSKGYAEYHGESRFGEDEYKIIEQEVPIGHVWWDHNDINEWSYDPSNDVRFMKTSNGEIYGAKLPDGTIYINPNKLNANTPIHEFSHLWEQIMPTAWKKGVSIFKETTTGKKLVEHLKKDGNYSQLSEEELWSEAMNTHIGNLGEEQYQRKPKGKMAEFIDWFKNTMSRFWNTVTGRNELNKELALTDFTNKVLGDLLGEKDLTPESNLEQNKNVQYSKADLKEGAKRLIRDLVSLVKGKQGTTAEKRVFGKVTKEGAEYLSKLTGLEITQNTKFIIDRSGVNHTINKHGGKSEIQRGQVPIYDKDFENITEIMSNPQNIISIRKIKRDGEGIQIEGTLNGEDYFVIQAHRSRKDELALTTMWKRKGDTMENPSIKTSETLPSSAKIPNLINFNTDDVKNVLNNGNIDFHIVNENDNEGLNSIIPSKTVSEVIAEIQNNGLEAGVNKLKESSWYNNLSETKKIIYDSQNLFSNENIYSTLIKNETNRAESNKQRGNEKVKKERESGKEKIKDVKTEYKEKIENLKVKYAEKIAEIKTNTAKTSRERIAKVRNIQKQAYNDLVNLVTTDKIKRQLTPTETSRLIKSAAAILNTNNTAKALDSFINLYNKINTSENEKQLANDKNRVSNISNTVNDAFADGKTLEEIYNDNPSLFRFDSSKEIARRLFERLESQNKPDSNALDRSLENSRIANEALKNKRSFKQIVTDAKRRWIKEVSDRQFLPKHLAKKLGMKGTYDRMIANGGASASANQAYKKVYDKVFAMMTNEDKTNFNEIIKLRRIISIDKNRESRGLAPIDHEGGTNRFEAQVALDQMKTKIGDKKFDKLSQDATTYFDAFRELLGEMKSNGLINQGQYDSMIDLDYRPTVFMNHLFDLEFEDDGNGNLTLKNARPIVGNNFDESVSGMSKDQIRSIQEGSTQLILNDSELLLGNAILGRKKAMFMNEVNKTFITKDFPTAKVKYEELKAKPAKELKLEDRRFIKYFDELNTMIKENPMVDITPSGNPKFAKSDLPTGWKRAYYFENGIRKEFFMRDDFYEQWHDTMNKLIDGTAKDIISTVSGSAVTKMMATGRNPGFALVNTPRDFGSVLMFSPEYSKFTPYAVLQLTKDAVKGIGEIFKYNNTEKDSILTKYLDYGGGMDFLNTEGENPLVFKWYEKIFGKSTNNKTKTIFTKAFDYATFKSLSNYSEMMFRVAVFDRAVQNRLKDLGAKNITDLDQETQDNIYYSAVASARSVLDFNQGGRTVKALESVVPYINAATQGTRVLADRMTENPYDTISRLLQGSTMLASMALGFSLLAMKAFGDDDDDKRDPLEKYLDVKDRLTTYQKRGYFHFFTGNKNKDGEYDTFKIAVPQALTPFYAMIDAGMDDLIRMKLGKETKSFGYATEQFSEAFSANVDPFGLSEPAKIATKNPFVKAAVTYASGYDYFRNQQLDKSIDKVPKPAEGRQNSKVEDFYKKWGMETGLSPVRMKYAVESVLTSPETNMFLGIIYGGADAITGYDSGFNDKKGFVQTALGSLQKRITAETSEYGSMMNSISDDDRKAIEKKAFEDELINEEADKIIRRYKSPERIMSAGQEINALIKKKDIPEDKKVQLVTTIVERVKKYEVSGESDPRIWDIKYNTFNSADAQAEAIVRYYGKDFQKKPDVMRKLTTNNVLTDKVWMSLMRAQKVKQEE